MSRSDQSLHAKTVLLLDASACGGAEWAATRAAAQDLLASFPPAELPVVALLGTEQALAPAAAAALLSDAGPPLQPRPRLLGATLRALLDGQLARVRVVLIASGPVYDLEDWLSWPSIEGWALVRVGSRAIQLQPLLPEHEPQQIAAVLAQLRQPRAPATPPAHEGFRWSSRGLRWALDPTGFPLVWVEPIQRFVQLFPLTKVQLERFLVATPSPFGDDWYEELLRLNPRASLRTASAPYEQLFATGLSSEEAIALARWFGPGFALPDAEQWRTCFAWLNALPALAIPPELDGCAWEARQIWLRVERELHPHSLADLALLSQGVFEWVSLVLQASAPQYVALGCTRPHFSAVVRPDRFKPLAGGTGRLHDRGLRLVRHG